MSIIPDADYFLTHECTIIPRIGRDGAGQPVLGSESDPLACRHMATIKQLRQDNGDQITARSVFFITADYVDELLDESVIRYNAVDFEVITAAKIETEEQGEIHHWEVLCR